jgi:aminoglycoside phosphotransferase (APT) family kinase protein
MNARVDAELVALAAGFGLQPTRVLQTGPGRVTLQARNESGERFVLKTAESPEALAGDVSANALLAAAGLPVPEIVAYVDGSPSVLVLRWIDGDPLSSRSPVEAQREIGRMLRTVHRLPGGPPYSGQPTILGWVTAWTQELAGWWPSVGGTGAQVRRLRGWLDDLAPVLVGRAGCLTLFDGRAEHVLVRGGRVVGLIDLHDVGPGDPAMDLAVLGLTDPDLIAGVLSGYGADEPADELSELPGLPEATGLPGLIGFYLLLRRLAGAEWQLRQGSELEGRLLLDLAVRQTDRD